MIDTILLPVTLAFDAFAVAVCYGTTLPKTGFQGTFKVAFSFAAFQFAMPVIGWHAGSSFQSAIREFDHWIAFGLLLYVGQGMIRDSRKVGTCPEKTDLSRLSVLLLYALATSLDALAAGVALSMIAKPIWLPATIAFASTFVLSLAGVVSGAKTGASFGMKAGLYGGFILIGIGTKILAEHLFFGG